MHKGGCLCGAIRYETDAALADIVNCHCSQCRRFHGHIGPYTGVARSELRISGEDSLRWYRSSAKAERGFCANCGSSLFFRFLDRDDIDIAAGTLDSAAGLRTAGHIFVGSKGEYYEITDALPQKQEN